MTPKQKMMTVFSNPPNWCYYNMNDIRNQMVKKSFETPGYGGGNILNELTYNT